MFNYKTGRGADRYLFKVIVNIEMEGEFITQTPEESYCLY